MFKNFLKKLVKEIIEQEKRESGWLRDEVVNDLPVGVSFLTPDMRVKRLGAPAGQGGGLLSQTPEADGKSACDICGVNESFRTGRPFKVVRVLESGVEVENTGIPVRDERGKVTGMVVIESVADAAGRRGAERLRGSDELAELLRGYAVELKTALSEPGRPAQPPAEPAAAGTSGEPAPKAAAETHAAPAAAPPVVPAAAPPAEAPAGFIDMLVENSPDGIFTVDGRGRISYANRAAEEMLGRDKGPLAGRHIAGMFKDGERELVEGAFLSAAEKDQRQKNLRVTVPEKGGERYIMVSFAPTKSGDEAHKVAGFCKDVTEEQKSEQEKEEFFAMLSHDLKTPLTSIIGYTSLLLNEEVGKIDGDVRISVEGIQVNSEKMLNLVKNFLSAGRIEKEMQDLKPMPMKVDSLIMESLKQIEPQIRDKNIRVETMLAPNMPRVIVDRSQMERVINNLVTNAIKFTPVGGRILINSYQTNDGYLTLEVSDTGAGIPPDEIPMLFDKYYQGKDAGMSRGSGLGLYIAKNIVEAHQGNIKVTSPEGEGTTFTIRLPQIV